jgi:hypothetical protein
VNPEVDDPKMVGGSVCSHPLVSLIGLKGSEYRKAWNKLHREKCRKAFEAYKKREPEKMKEHWKASAKKQHAKNLVKYGCAGSTNESRKSEQEATMAYERWGPVEDALIMSGKFKEKELVKIVGRSIRAIQRRKWRLR